MLTEGISYAKEAKGSPRRRANAKLTGGKGHRARRYAADARWMDMIANRHDVRPELPPHLTMPVFLAPKEHARSFWRTARDLGEKAARRVGLGRGRGR